MVSKISAGIMYATARTATANRDITEELFAGSREPESLPAAHFATDKRMEVDATGEIRYRCPIRPGVFGLYPRVLDTLNPGVSLGEAR